MGMSDSGEPSTWRILLGKNYTTPARSPLRFRPRGRALSKRGSSVAPVEVDAPGAGW